MFLVIVIILVYQTSLPFVFKNNHTEKDAIQQFKDRKREEKEKEKQQQRKLNDVKEIPREVQELKKRELKELTKSKNQRELVGRNQYEVDNVSENLNIPQVPKFDKSKLKQLQSANRNSWAQKMATYEDKKSRSTYGMEVDLPEDFKKMVNEIKVYNGNTITMEKGIERLRELNKKYQNENEKIKLNATNSFEKVIDAVTESTISHNGYCIALKELEKIINQLKYRKNKKQVNREIENDESESLVPTTEGVQKTKELLTVIYREAIKILRSCSVSNIQKDKLSDYYSQMLHLCKEKGLLFDTAYHGRKTKTKFGYNVLALSTKLLEKIRNQLYKKLRLCITKNEGTSNKKVNRELRKFEGRLRLSRNHLRDMNSCIHTKEVQIREQVLEHNELEQEILHCKQELKLREITFEKRVIGDREFLHQSKLNKNLKQEVDDLKNMNKVEQQSHHALSEKLEKLTDQLKDTELFAKIKELKGDFQKRMECHLCQPSEQMLLRESIRQNFGRILKEEEKINKIEDSIRKLKEDNEERERKIKELKYQKKILQRKLNTVDYHLNTTFEQLKFVK